MSESDKSVFLFRIPPDLKIALREASKTGEVLTPAGE
jgi:hypothetical protein